MWKPKEVNLNREKGYCTSMAKELTAIALVALIPASILALKLLDPKYEQYSERYRGTYEGIIEECDRIGYNSALVYPFSLVGKKEFEKDTKLYLEDLHRAERIYRRLCVVPKDVNMIRNPVTIITSPREEREQ